MKLLLPPPLIDTDTTPAPSSTIDNSQRVSFGAMSLPRQLRHDGFPPEDVDPMGDGFEMIWPHAVVDATLVIQFTPRRNGADQGFVDDSVGAKILAFGQFPNPAVAIFPRRTSPQPATFGGLRELA